MHALLRSPFIFIALGLAACSDSVEEHVRKGNVLFSNRDLAGAEAEYARALEGSPMSSAALEGLGNVRFERGDPAGAAAWYEKAIVADPRAMNARHRLAVARTERGDIGGAIAALEAALTVDRQDVYALYALGGLEERLGRLDQAEARQRTALAREPGHRGARFALAGILVDTGRYDEADRELGRLESSGGEALAAYGYARLLAKQGKAVEAASRLDRVLALGVTHPARVLADDAFTKIWSHPSMMAIRARIEAATAGAVSQNDAPSHTRTATTSILP